MHPHDGRVVSNFIIQSLTGEDITLYGDGSQTRAFCYVDDLIDGMMRMMATGDDVNGPVNIGNPHEITVRELAERIIAMTGSSSKIVLRPLPEDDPLQRCPDITLAKSLLGGGPNRAAGKRPGPHDHVFQRPARQTVNHAFVGWVALRNPPNPTTQFDHCAAMPAQPKYKQG